MRFTHGVLIGFLGIMGGVGATAAMAQTLRPGLWEHQTTIKTSSGQMEKEMAQMQKQMAAMPPEQRKMMEQMFAQHGMSQIRWGAGGETSLRHCMTPQEAAAGLMPEHDKNCPYTVKRRTATSVQMSFSCKDGTQGEGEMRLQGDKAYSGEFKMRIMADKKPEQADMQQSGRWLSADCGAVKPLPSK